MKIYPALDLINGACVRLTRGSFDTKTVYDEDPVRILTKFKDAGAEFAHIVDLDGAKDPNRRQIDLLQKLARSSGLKIQAGGGIRSTDDVEGLLSAGIERVVIGTLAVENFDLVSKMFSRFGGDRLTLALDVFVDPTGDARIAVRGWQKKSRRAPQELIESFLPMGLRRVLCTDISKDGMLEGPNVELYWKLSQVFPQVEIQASGGVTSLEDLLALKKASVHSAIVGKAIYEQGFDLAEAIRRC